MRLPSTTYLIFLQISYCMASGCSWPKSLCNFLLLESILLACTPVLSALSHLLLKVSYIFFYSKMRFLSKTYLFFLQKSYCMASIFNRPKSWVFVISHSLNQYHLRALLCFQHLVIFCSKQSNYHPSTWNSTFSLIIFFFIIAFFFFWKINYTYISHISKLLPNGPINFLGYLCSNRLVFT